MEGNKYRDLRAVQNQITIYFSPLEKSPVFLSAKQGMKS
jgi:hypothetical protein